MIGDIKRPISQWNRCNSNIALNLGLIWRRIHTGEKVYINLVKLVCIMI